MGNENNSPKGDAKPISQRLEINPLIEENMLQMNDSEFCISQLTGNVTIKREKKYISKTKELLASSIDIKSWYDDLLNNYNDFINTDNGIDSKIKKFEDSLNEAKEKVEEMTKKVGEYEKKADNIDELLNNTDDYLMNDIIDKITNYFSNALIENFKLLGNLLIQYELLDIIIDNEQYFIDFVQNMFNAVDSEGNIFNLETINIHKSNLIEIEKRVDKKEYNDFCDYIESEYDRIAEENGIEGGYKITRAT